MQIRVRKYATQIEEILHEGGDPPATPLFKAPCWRSSRIPMPVATNPTSSR